MKIMRIVKNLTSLVRGKNCLPKSEAPMRRQFNLEFLEPRMLLSAAPIVSEVHPSGSGNGTYAADWFEVTNIGDTALDITGWKVDDSSNAFATAVDLRGLTSIPAGKSAIFFEGNATGSTDAAIIANFSTAWFGSAPPPVGFLIGSYGGSGVGLSTSGDAIVLFDAAGNRITGISFGTATANRTFDNVAGLGNKTTTLPPVSILSSAGVNGAFLSSNGLETTHRRSGLLGRLASCLFQKWPRGLAAIVRVARTGSK